MAGYQNFVAQKSLLKRLYGEERPNDALNDPPFADKKIALNQSDGGDDPTEILHNKVRKRRDFNASYCQYTLVS